MGEERQAGKCPLISVIVPVYNAEATLERCLRSLQGQTYENLEILLMDDGSTDGSGELCEKFAAEDPRFRVIHTPNQGVAKARNQALSLYRGDYLMYADADDFVSEEYVQRLYENLAGCGVSVATCEAYDCLPEEAESFRTPPREEPRIVELSEYNYLKEESHRVIWGAVYTREIVEGLRFSEEYHCSTDTLYFAQVLKRARKIAHTREKLYCYIQYPVSVSKGKFDRKKYSDLLVWKEVAALLAEEPGTAGKSARDVAVLKHVRALDRMRREGSKDAALAGEIRASLREMRRDVMHFPAPVRRRAGILARAYLPHLFELSVRLREKMRR